jgi:hypothetical protein
MGSRPRQVVLVIAVSILVISVLAVYSLRTSLPPITTTSTTTSTVTIAGATQVVTTTVFGQVKVVSATGSQAVLCTATRYFVGDIIMVTISKTTITSGNTTTVVAVTSTGSFTTDVTSSVYASATNATNSVGYVVTSTSTDPNVAPSSAWTVMTCTYLP